MSAYGAFDGKLASELIEKAKIRELEKNLERGTVFLIKDQAMGFVGKKPEGRHFWFVINKDPKLNEVIVMSIGTSQNTPFARANNAVNPAVSHQGILTLTSKDYAPLNKETFVDCNNCLKLAKGTIHKMYLDGKMEICAAIDSTVVDRLVECYEKGDNSEAETLKLLK